MEVYKVAVDDITVGSRMRSVKPDRVDALAESIAAIGLQTPISIWSTEDESEVHLVAGAHRLAAAKKLGWEDIECVLVNMDDIDRRRWEIAENLHRAELTVLERDQHVAEWIRLTEDAEKKEQEKQKDILVQNEPKLGRKPSGRRAAERELGIDHADASRAVKVASLTEEAKETAREVGLDDNRSALLKAAKAQEEGKDASEILRDIAAEKEAKKQVPRPTPSHVVAAEKGRSDGPFTLEDIHRLHSLADYEQLEVILTAVDLGWAAAHRKLERYELAA